MKNFKKILSFACISVMLFSLPVFAWDADEAVPFKLKADKTTIAAGETITVTIYNDVPTTETYENVQAMMGNIDYNSAEFSVSTDGVDIANVAVEAAPSGMNTKDASVAIMYMSPITVTSDNLISFKFTAADTLADGEYTLELNLFQIADVNWSTTAAASNVLTITVGEDEEVFEIDTTKTGSTDISGDTMKDATNGNDVAATGDIVIAIFAKNVTDEVLGIGDYGIYFGKDANGNLMKYPGQMEVPAKKAWAVKLVGPKGSLEAGEYTYGIYAKGQPEVISDKPWIIRAE